MADAGNPGATLLPLASPFGRHSGIEVAVWLIGYVFEGRGGYKDDKIDIYFGIDGRYYSGGRVSRKTLLGRLKFEDGLYARQHQPFGQNICSWEDLAAKHGVVLPTIEW
ncbi:MAG: hypothetical protein ACYCSF_13710 [Acidimicrobiales bacterium]